jgi:D-alanine--poly(phosphoribitol) ligase subunit 1
MENINSFSNQVINPLLDVIKKFQDKNAFCINGIFYTYKQFGETISKIRYAIASRSEETLNIGLVTNDDLETYASIFALWLEGYAYVPLNPNQPEERNLEIISQAGVKLIIDSSADPIFSKVPNIESGKLIFRENNLEPKVIPEDRLTYILFTSGSTGKPKGVPIKRASIGHFMKSFWDSGIKINENDRCLQSFDLTFDVSVQSYLVPLTSGACTYTIPHDQIKYSYIYGLFDDHKLTFGAMAPSMIRYLRPYFDEIEVPSMRYCLLVAEASTIELINEWSGCIPNAEIFDFYGPTEATIYCTYYKYDKNGDNKNLNGLLSIGKPMNGLVAIIIDEEKKILGANEKGELCISGGQLTDGYWNNPEKNKQSFFETEYNGTQTRFYRTGDLCYLDNDGDIMYSGRIDFQVKIQGYRIELGEIEHHAREFAKGRNAVAVSFENNSGNTEIALFMEGESTNISVLVDYLKSKIPNYMIPTKIISQEEFPLNSNGKIDRNALKKLIIV